MTITDLHAQLGELRVGDIAGRAITACCTRLTAWGAERSFACFRTSGHACAIVSLPLELAWYALHAWNTFVPGVPKVTPLAKAGTQLLPQ